MTKQELLEILKVKLQTKVTSSEPFFENSIMTYEVICEHDDGHLCESRLKWIIDFINNNFELKQPN